MNSPIHIELERIYIKKMILAIEDDDSDIAVSVYFDLKHEVLQDNKYRLTMEMQFIKDINIIFDINLCGDFVIQANEKDLERILRVNCSSIMYPFLREKVARIIGETIINKPVYLPSCDFIEMYENWKNTQ